MESRTVAQAVKDEITKQKGYITGMKKFTEGLSELEKMVGDKNNAGLSVSDIITAWKTTTGSNGVTYHATFYPGKPTVSRDYLSQGQEVLFDQQNFLKNLEDMFGNNKSQDFLKPIFQP